MRLSSRLLSFLLTIILVGLSVGTASAGTSHPLTDNQGRPRTYTYGATVSLARVDSVNPVYVGTTITFRIIVRRGDHDIPFSGTVSSLTRGGVIFTTIGDDADDNLVAIDPLFSKEIEYTIADADLGSAVERIVPFQVRLVFTPPDNNHPQAEILSNEYSVFVRRQAGASTVSSGVNLVFVVDEPSSTAVGEQVRFRLKVATGKYALLGDSFVVQKELYDASGNKIGSAEPAALFGIPYLPTGSTSEDLSQAYSLKQEDVDAGHIRFFYRWVVQDHHLFNVDGTPADLNDDFEHVFTREHIMGDVPTATPTPTSPTTRVTPTATPIPNQLVGATGAVRVTRQGSNRIFFNLTQGQDFSMPIGVIAPNGTRSFHRSGYVRDESLGQTYAVVLRVSDNRVVRVWISPDDPIVDDIPWPEVLEFYNFHRNIVDAIPLDEMHPAPNQLVDAGGRFYVFYAGEWRHIPDIPTFQARNFYWCDMTSADANWLSRVSIGRPLQSSGGTDDPNYPNCRE